MVVCVSYMWIHILMSVGCETQITDSDSDSDSDLPATPPFFLTSQSETHIQ